MKYIFMLNTLPIINFDQKKGKQKTAGNQTLYNTLKGYSENGYAVTMITFFDVPKVSLPFPNITVRRSIFFKPINLLMKVKKKISDIKKKSNNKKGSTPTLEIARNGNSLFLELWGICGYIEGLLLTAKKKPDIIYGYEIYSTRPAKRLADKLNVPCVSRFQGTELGFFIEDDSKFNNAVTYKKGTEVSTDLVIMANDGTDGDKVLEKLNMDMNKMRFWVNGLHDKDKYININKDIDYKEKMKLPEDAFVICTANRFVDWKRIDRIIKVMSELDSTNINAYLIAIGDGPEKRALIELVETLNLKNVIFTGALEHEDTIYHIANADLYITLNHSGNLGNSILEALALGTALCTLKNDSVERVLRNNYNALLLDTLNEKEISDEIALSINENKLEQLRLNAKSYAKDNLLSWSERMQLEVEEINILLKE
ncbi:glycosyltransferase family 4 protein [Paenibacillus odorifer]|jgi:glycosyltransferase involved in cell wall biosynthesis|uniref:glycosyltransferase family 4 protein n=1 Tax=Paenibacillus odorifer TaxID=189426 RepID=UPI00096C29FB|nr:glycosyltransferase family 4 protein [Paenibacillus odorifer]OMD89412.1 hypothetical protein BSK67_25140 [Paenibacillus odorifer]